MTHDPEPDDLFELTPEEEELYLEFSRLSLAHLFDGGFHLLADRAGDLFDGSLRSVPHA